jgi:hypothetical protein
MIRSRRGLQPVPGSLRRGTRTGDMQRYFGVSPPSVHQMVLGLERPGVRSRTRGPRRPHTGPRSFCRSSRDPLRCWWARSLPRAYQASLEHRSPRLSSTALVQRCTPSAGDPISRVLPGGPLAQFASEPSMTAADLQQRRHDLTELGPIRFMATRPDLPASSGILDSR